MYRSAKSHLHTMHSTRTDSFLVVASECTRHCLMISTFTAWHFGQGTSCHSQQCARMELDVEVP
jgi:hypothetical protein